MSLAISPAKRPRRLRRALVLGLAASLVGITAPSAASAATPDLTYIGEVQGSIDDDQTNFTSPLLGEEVYVQGIVTQETLDGSGAHGFFLQESSDATDDDPNSSDGIYVYNSSYTDLRTAWDSPAEEEYGDRWDVTVGDEIIVRAEVKSYYGNTQFTGGTAFVWDVVDHHEAPLSQVDTVEAAPPNDADDAKRYFHRRLGMQMTVATGSTVVAGRDVYGNDGEVWAVNGDHPVAQRNDYSARVFRDAHPLDNDSEQTFDDANGYRFLIGSQGVKAAANDETAMIAPAKTFDVVNTDATGGTYYGYGKYSINVAENLDLTSSRQPADNNPITPAGDGEAAVSAYNVENLYDLRDNPNSDCDFEGNPGCDDGESTITPPFDYVPGSVEEYESRLERMADQITTDLHSPAVIMVQETEGQDVCSVNPDYDPANPGTTERLLCDLDNTGDDNEYSDGAPDSLQELALVIAEREGADYAATFDVDARDLRGISTAYLYRTDRVSLPEANGDDPLLGSNVTIDYDGTDLDYNSEVANPKALNAALPDRVLDECTSSGVKACNGSNVYPRAAQVGKFRLWNGPVGESDFSDVTLVNNHFSSGPDRRVFHRIEQATYGNAIAETALNADADRNVVFGGDLNVFPRDDDPFPEGTHIIDDWYGPSDQLSTLYDGPLDNLYDSALATTPEDAYTYTYQGQAQTLDHMWVSPALSERINDFSIAHINADYPADATHVGEDPAFGRWGVSDHDPAVATVDLGSAMNGPGDLVDLLDSLYAAGDLTDHQHDWLTKKVEQAEDHPFRYYHIKAKVRMWMLLNRMEFDTGRTIIDAVNSVNSAR
ncbi:hypothetical protein [Haloglycomyces albus]|uniref:hypothetical protein n=1 Tax=Haloglycomyces albus TaxID=526067 RepID=UPI0004B66F9E|nr:hypothetical protein [Haloglycomyces albus]